MTTLGAEREGDCAAVVLAAGAGSRFGAPTHKLVAPFRGRPLVAWAVASALEAAIGPVVVVTGAVDVGEELGELARSVELVTHGRWSEGVGSSLTRALAWCSERGLVAAVVGLGDQPLVPASAWRAVAAARGAPIVTATYEGRRRPPVRLDRTVWPLVADHVDEGARELMRRRPDLVAEVACDGDPADIDTLEDLRRAEG